MKHVIINCFKHLTETIYKTCHYVNISLKQSIKHAIMDHFKNLTKTVYETYHYELF